VVERDGRLQRLRSTTACWEDSDLEALRDERVFLLHARNASCGSVTINNTHPFEQEIDGKPWFFCHNGTIRDPLPSFSTLGSDSETDSEWLFHALLPYLWENSILEGIADVANRIRDFTSLNSFLLGPGAMWILSAHTAYPAYFTLSLADTSMGPVISSEPLGEISARWDSISNRHVVHIDRTRGTVRTFPMGD
jgi:predicted glutamine amidotransferase